MSHHKPISIFWWAILAIPIVAPAYWFYWDPNYYIFGGDTPAWGSFQYLIEWHFPYLWDEFDGAGMPFVNNAPLPTAFFFWVLWKLSLSTLVQQILFFIVLSAISVFGFYRTGKLFYDKSKLLTFVFIASLIYLLNPFGFYGENRRIFTTEFLVAYNILPFFVSCFITALIDNSRLLKEALIASVASLALHNFNLIPALSYLGVAYISIAAYYLIAVKNTRWNVIKYLVVFICASFLLAAYHLYAMYQYFQVSSISADLANIVVNDVSTAGPLLNTILFAVGVQDTRSPLLVILYLVPIIAAIFALMRFNPRQIVGVCALMLAISLFMMDAGYLATKVFGLTNISDYIYRIFRFPHIKFTGPYILAISILCGVYASSFPISMRFVLLTVGFAAIWNDRGFTDWLPIQLHKPSEWIELSKFMQHEYDSGKTYRTLKLPSVSYFVDGVGGEEFERTPQQTALGVTPNPWMVHGTALGGLLPQPIFSRDMTVGSRHNPCVTRLHKGELDVAQIKKTIELLGIERVLVSNSFNYQMNYTPIKTLTFNQLLVEKIRSIRNYSHTVFENKHVDLNKLDSSAVPIVYIADNLSRVTPEQFIDCDFPSNNGVPNVRNAYYAEKPSIGLEFATSVNSAKVESIYFKRISPGKYLVELNGLPKYGTITLVLNNTFADWVITNVNSFSSQNLGFFQDRRVKVNGFATAWVLDAEHLCENFECEINTNGQLAAKFYIQYSPQNTYLLLINVTLILVTAILIGIFLLHILMCKGNESSD